eukprot:CAMPEP_0177670078 /NCGR_PEP_ID=MMETSP0447-20121125/23866_1 /TAXON_ID=0 /ORGANISM="Stygamoeba regulata, Strain BSH-02190019" /LENGTH=179 /DNA_ID=CAMNT_0019177155 /DNA_START=346 /DNA_END=885 /DNA_ORIENTATION=-
MIVLGSGGHTAEMLALLGRLPLQRYTPRLYVCADTDNHSAQKATAFESEHMLGSPLNNLQKTYSILVTRRSREVGQSYVTSLFTTLRALLQSLWFVWKENPDLILCNGPGTCVPICFAAFLFKVLLFRRTTMIYVESICRVQTLSLSALLLRPILDRLFVQWPALAERYSDAEFHGRLA